MLISVHVPKTAGTAIGDLFDVSTGRRVMFDYDPQYKHVAAPQPEIVEAKAFIESFFKVIHGQFYYRKYSILFPRAQFISCVRNPIERIISHYFHVAALSSKEDWRAPLIAEGSMNVVDFADSDANVRDAMAVHLAGRDIGAYDFIFITEFLALSCAEFERRFSFRFVRPVERINTRESRGGGRETLGKIVPPDEEQKRALYNRCVADLEIYEQARRSFLDT